ncbi:ATP-binding cassette domain-containing protein [Thermosulfurimonas marina]|uniref:ATP-binding cassette domain-containing protein n=1 Tax=Thermosulfurimonas marina TaxID=2047767 RepID=A0A6H1WU92_9BACT|nr:ATP-binding cassette domain-containing protein [Thermosulfurimonas marina]QJA06676.1 ATP-binding cassette domain-containing protein [Thermosulfurimonas marina]
MSAAVRVERLIKDYGKLRALSGISFEIREGELFALLGPNGAGKTTTIRILTGLTRPSGGRAWFFGRDIFADPLYAKRMAGLVPQATNLDLELTVWENLFIHGLLFGLSCREIRRRAEELLRFSGLWERRGDRVRTLSGGMRRRLLIVRALLHEPHILFLDEPTVGLDPHIRRRLWGLIKQIQTRGTTILLTTHYIEEAEFLADRVAFLDRGRIVALDTPGNLIAHLGEVAVDLVTEEGLTTRFFRTREEAEREAVRLSRAGESVTIRRVNLEDAFLHFTGRKV